MATSRTGTAAYKHWRRRTLTKAQQDGITNCPICGTTLNYQTGLHPNSAEPDHIIPHKYGGRETPENARVICRHCNQSRGDGTHNKNKEPKQTTTDFNW